MLRLEQRAGAAVPGTARREAILVDEMGQPRGPMPLAPAWPYALKVRLEQRAWNSGGPGKMASDLRRKTITKLEKVPEGMACACIIPTPGGRKGGRAGRGARRPPTTPVRRPSPRKGKNCRQHANKSTRDTASTVQK